MDILSCEAPGTVLAQSPWVLTQAWPEKVKVGGRTEGKRKNGTFPCCIRPCLCMALAFLVVNFWGHLTLAEDR